MIILPASCYNHIVVVTMPAAERAGRDVIRKGNLMKGKMPGKLAALLLAAALCVDTAYREGCPADNLQ